MYPYKCYVGNYCKCRVFNSTQHYRHKSICSMWLIICRDFLNASYFTIIFLINHLNKASNITAPHKRKVKAVRIARVLYHSDTQLL